MKAHVIENGKVINTVLVDFLEGPNLVEATEGQIGWGYVNGAFVPPEGWVEETKAMNANAAKSRQDAVLSSLAKNTQKKALGLPPENPPETVAYNPPLPPGVTPPAINSILITITREAGWQGNIGWKAVISSGEENFTPANLAMAEYTNPGCDGYLYTTGAFQQDGDTWYAICPPGQEKGDVDVNLGLLYGAAQLACFTFKAGNQEQKVYAYEEVI